MQLKKFATPARTVDAGATLQDAARAMDRWHVGSLVVTEEGDPAGMISDRDVALRGLLEGSGSRTLVRECMRMPLVSLPASATIGEATRTLQEHGIRRLALTGEDGALVGVVSADDLLQAIGRQVALLTSTIGRELSAEAEGSPSGSSTYGSE